MFPTTVILAALLLLLLLLLLLAGIAPATKEYNSKNEDVRFCVISSVVFIKPNNPTAKTKIKGAIFLIFCFLILPNRSTANLEAAMHNIGNNGIRWKNETYPMICRKASKGRAQSKSTKSFLMPA